MTQAFDKAFEFTHGQEGGDVLSTIPGEKSETYGGIYRFAHPSWAGWSLIDAGDTTSDTLHALVKDFYFGEFWVALNLEQLPFPLSALVFDFAVNSGADRAVRTLQGLLPVRVDGAIGGLTSAAARGLDSGKLNTRYIAARLDYLNDLPNWTTFSRGWSQRVVELLKFAAQ